jgi:hypothetical protein
VRHRPITLWVNREGQDLREIGPFQQQLLPRHEAGQQLHLPLIVLKQLCVLGAWSKAGFASSSLVGQLSTKRHAQASEVPGLLG